MVRVLVTGDVRGRLEAVAKRVETLQVFFGPKSVLVSATTVAFVSGERYDVRRPFLCRDVLPHSGRLERGPPAVALDGIWLSRTDPLSLSAVHTCPESGTAGQVISSFEAIMNGKRVMPVPTYFLASQISVDPAESQVPGDGEGLCSLHSRVRKLHFLREYPATEAQYEMERMLVSHGSFRPELITRPVCVSHSTCALGRQQKIKTTDGSEAYADEHDEQGAFATALLGPDWRGAPREIAPNLHYLGPHGVADVHGLSVAFVSGRCSTIASAGAVPTMPQSTHGVRWSGALGVPSVPRAA